MSNRPLNSDELGAKGEAFFDGICADAKLVCNASNRDRTGWDRIVEFPLPEARTASLDKRPAPISCHVQVKTIWADKRSVSLRLSSAERLAKDPKPSFIYVLAVRPDLSLEAAFLIHLTKE